MNQTYFIPAYIKVKQEVTAKKNQASDTHRLKCVNLVTLFKSCVMFTEIKLFTFITFKFRHNNSDRRGKSIIFTIFTKCKKIN